MRVLHIITEMEWRGGEQQAATLIEELQLRDINCTVICPPQSIFSEYCKRHQIPQHNFICGGLIGLLNGFYIYFLCRSLEIDIIHVHSSGAHTKAIVLNYGHKSKIPIIVSRRVMSPIKNRFFTRYKYNHKNVKKIICSSKMIQALVSSKVSDPSRCVTIYDSVNIERFASPGNRDILHKYGLKNTDYLVSSIAALEPNKDLPTFIEAARLAIKDGSKAKFLIIGKGWRKTDLEDKIDALGLQDQILLTDFIEDISEILPFIKINVLCSIQEGLGTALLESIASHVAIIGTKTGGIPEIILDDKTGYLINVGDSENLARKLLYLEKNETERQRLITQAEKHLYANFSSQVMTSKTIAVYEEALTHSDS